MSGPPPPDPADPDEPADEAESSGGSDQSGDAEPGQPLPPRPSERRGGRSDEELPGERPADSQRRVGQSSSLLRELPILVFVALALALLIKTFLVQAFFIPSDSMENTLLQGDRVLVNKFASHFGEVKRGEVVVFRDPGGWLPAGIEQDSNNPVIKGLKDVFVFVGLLPSSSEKDLIKRVIGVPGDRVACCTNGKVTVNGIPIDESYIYPGDKPSDRQFSVTVPPNRLWVMGDHRSLSADSRVHMDEPGNGTIPSDNVVGRAFVLVWPLDRWSTLGVPDTFKRKEIDGAALTTSAIGLTALIPVALMRRRRAGPGHLALPTGGALDVPAALWRRSRRRPRRGRIDGGDRLPSAHRRAAGLLLRLARERPERRSHPPQAGRDAPVIDDRVNVA